MHKLILLALVGCAGVPSKPSTDVCVTPCGLILVGSTECEALATYEAKVLGILSSYVDADVCTQLWGWTLRVRPDADNIGCWVDKFDRYVCGLTYCQSRLMEIGTDKFNQSSFTHEVIHSALECPWSNVNHEGAAWEQKGWYRAAIQESKR